MYQQQRIKKILDILREHGYVTVKFLTQELHYSNATINRDLNVLQAQKLIKRSYGGVELMKKSGTSLIFRYNKMRPAKNKIAKKASQYICDGDTIFIDGSTTSQYLGKYITNHKNLKVITNNIALVSYLSEHGINVICLGGRVMEAPNMLGGDDTAENAMKYHADKAFFSVGSVLDDGRIGGGDSYHLLNLTMQKNSNESFCLADSAKINVTCSRFLGDLSLVDCFISDYCFSDEIKKKYNHTKFIEV